MLDAIDPRYATAASKARKRAGTPKVETVKAIPEPRARLLYRIGKVERTLSDWAKASHIPKATLHHRVVDCGMTMAAAIERGRGRLQERSG